jgi:hypothetical protein
MPRRSLLLVLLAVTGCQSGRDFTLFGYSTRPQYDDSIRTVYVPTMKNTAFQTTPNRELEVDITKAIIREIEAKTRMKVVSDRERADTELLGTLVGIRKSVVNVTQQNLTREAEVTATANFVWRDLRTGAVLSNRRPAVAPEAPIPFDPSLPPPEAVPVDEKAVPAQIVVVGRIIPELGESNATANLSVANQMAKQVVHMMEAAW